MPTLLSKSSITWSTIVISSAFSVARTAEIVVEEAKGGSE